MKEIRNRTEVSFAGTINIVKITAYMKKKGCSEEEFAKKPFGNE